VGRIHFCRPLLPISSFCLTPSGGPYIFCVPDKTGARSPARAAEAYPAVMRPSGGDVGIVAFRLQQRDGGAHGSDDEDSRHNVRKHIPHDLFRRLLQVVAPNEDPHLFFRGGMAAQILHAPRLQGLHAPVLIDRIRIVCIFGGRLLL